MSVAEGGRGAWRPTPSRNGTADDATAACSRRAWLVSVSILWACVWLQALVTPRPFVDDVGLAVFGLACLDTVAFGATLGRPSPVRPCAAAVARVLSAAALGVVTLGLLSWGPIVAFLGVASLASRSAAFLGLVLLVGLPYSLVLALGGFGLLATLLTTGWLLRLAWTQWCESASRRRAHATRGTSLR